MMLDILQAICWSITYVFLIAYGLKYKKCGIPLLSLFMNYAWETVALIITLIESTGLYSLLMHGSWFLLDTLIIFLMFRYDADKKQRLKYVMILLPLAVIFYWLFRAGYPLILAYSMDLIMSLDFLFFALFKEVRKGFIAYAAALFKLLGDLAAWLNFNETGFLTFFVLGVNAAYLVILIIKKTDSPLYCKKTAFLSNKKSS